MRGKLTNNLTLHKTGKWKMTRGVASLLDHVTNAKPEWGLEMYIIAFSPKPIPINNNQNVFYAKS